MMSERERITGKTRIFGTIADPIEHVRAPMVLNRLFAERGLDAVMVPIHVRPDGLAKAMDGFRAMPNLGGFCVTIPHKLEVLRLCDRVGKQARLVGAVNVVRRDPDGKLVGENFDGAGFVQGLLAEGNRLEGQRVLLVGAGGAGRAIAFAMPEARASALVIANRSPDKAVALAAEVASAFPGFPVAAGPADPAGFDVVVNATSLGLKPGDALPFPVTHLEPGALVAEIVMIPDETALIAAAKARGLRVQYGRHMFDHQTRLIAEFLGCG